MSGPWSGYNTEPANFQFDVRKYADAYGKIEGVGCDGTTSGIDATKPEYSSPFIVGGSSGYSFTNERIPIASPSAPYSVIEGYNDSNKNYRDNFPKNFPSLLSGGKRRRRKHSKKHSRRHRKSKYTQYGCSKKNKCGGKKRTRRSGGRASTRKRSKTRRGGADRLARRGGKRTMRGGVSGYADYTKGRNTSQDIPYGNEAYSFGQGLDSNLGPNESALASPPPFLPYNDCGKVMRN